MSFTFYCKCVIDLKLAAITRSVFSLFNKKRSQNYSILILNYYTIHTVVRVKEQRPVYVKIVASSELGKMLKTFTYLPQF